MNNSHFTAAALLAVVVALGIVGNSDINAEESAMSEYCGMTALHKETKGQYGWPAYKENVTCP